MVAKNLDKYVKAGCIRMTLVDKKDSMHHKIGSIRASVDGDGWAERIRIPFDQIVRYGSVVIGNAVKVEDDKKVIIFANDEHEPLHFDILVCTTGTCMSDALESTRFGTNS